MVRMSLIELSPEHRHQLLTLARQSIEHGLKHGVFMPVDLGTYDAQLQDIRAAFVTLKKHSELRGCVGALEARESLVEDVSKHAFAAAFQDTRFPKLARGELKDTHISISVLSPLQPILFQDEADLLAQIRPGKDGLVLQYRRHRGTFLPSVWASLPDKNNFWQQLKRKAGLPSDFCSDRLIVSRYEVLEFGELG